jgi:uncharacterized protein (TIGR04255 family)
VTEAPKSNSLTDFKKPPVVEAWIEFYFDLSEENIPWTEEYAVNFIKENFPNYSPKNSEYFARISINSKGEPDFSKTDKFFNRIRAFSKNGEYCIQAGRNVLIFNQINKGDWLGYDNMRDKAFEVLEQYLNYRKFERLLNTCLHYRDLIVIPSANEKINLEDYFKIYPKVCESFGDTWRINLELVLPQSCKQGVTIFTLLQVSDKNVKNFRFYIDWHVTPYDGSIPTNTCEAKLWFDAIHSDLRKRFEETFTDKAKKELFRNLE